MSSAVFPQPGSTGLLIVDIQQKLLPAMGEAGAAVVRQSAILIEVASSFGWPVFYTEQYPQGLGPTEPGLLVALQTAGAARAEKLEFSCARNACFAETILPRLPPHVVVAGMETHVCVLQTVADLQARGHQTFLPHDAVCSRRAENKRNGIDLCVRAGAVETNVETLLFYGLQKAGGDTFKRLSRLIR